MAVDGHQSTRSSLFQTYQRQTSVSMSGVNRSSMPMPFFSAASHPEQDNTSNVPWFHNSQDDPYELSFIPTNIKNRKQADNGDWDGEADLQGLVSNILDEEESRENLYSKSLSTCSSIWSSKTLREDLQQYFPSEAKTLNNLPFSSNRPSHETLSKVQQQSVNKESDELSQQSSGLADNQQWLYNLPNGDNYSLHSHKRPPGLPFPKTLNTNPSQIQQMTYSSMLPRNDRGNDRPLNNFPELSDIFRPQNEMSNSCSDAFYEDHYTQSKVNPFCDEIYDAEDMNQLVSSFQSFMPFEHDSPRREAFPNMHKQTVGLYKEGGLPEQWKITSPVMSTQSSPAMQMQKQLLGDMGSMQRGRVGEVKKQTFKLDSFQDLPDFSSQQAEYLQKSNVLSAHLSLQNQHQNQMTMHRGNMNLGMNQYLKHHIQQSQIQKKIKSQMEREKKKIQMSGFTGETFSMRQQTNTHMLEGDKQPFSQNPYFNFQGKMHCQRLDGENTMVSPGNVQQFTSLMYPVSDARRFSSMPLNSNFSSRPTPYHDVPGMNVGGMMLTNEAAALNSIISGRKIHRGGNTDGMASALAGSLLMNQGGPVVQLYFHLDDCYEQWRSLEKETKRSDIILKKTFPGKWTTIMTNGTLPKTPPNLTRVDQLVVNQMREQAKVASLLDRMECLCSIPLHINIHTALKNHHIAVCIIQARCRDSSASLTKNQQQGIHFAEDRDKLLMIAALKDLATSTRRLRTALWCALQMTLPKPVKIQDHHAYEEATCTERCSSVLQSYSFCL